tara:strand:- start:567 stop:1253 length:687 start_codon:yes stop_codon:yes gene_type:complete
MRKHHNRLYFNKYDHKTIFRMSYANALYPTTDENLYNIVQGKNDDLKFHNYGGSVVKINAQSKALAKFILEHRSKMHFRLQQNKAIFYSQKKLAKLLVESFWEDWYGSETVDPKFAKLGKNTVGCKRLPHGKFKYQIHLKKDVHQHLSKTERENLWAFLERNDTECLVSNKYVLDYLVGKYPHCYHGYFYVSEEQMLTPIYMMAQKGIDKVVKFEKVKNGTHTKTNKS